MRRQQQVAIPPCVPSVQGLLDLQQSHRGLLTCGAQSSRPTGPHGANRGGSPELENHLGMECHLALPPTSGFIPCKVSLVVVTPGEQNPSSPGSSPLSFPHVFCLASHDWLSWGTQAPSEAPPTPSLGTNRALTGSGGKRVPGPAV